MPQASAHAFRQRQTGQTLPGQAENGHSTKRTQIPRQRRPARSLANGQGDLIISFGLRAPDESGIQDLTAAVMIQKPIHDCRARLEPFFPSPRQAGTTGSILDKRLVPEIKWTRTSNSKPYSDIACGLH